MLPKLIKSTQKETVQVFGHLLRAGQKVLQHDWRYQEIQSALYHPDLTNSLETVWQFWATKVPHALPEFSAMRKLPEYVHEGESMIWNVNQAIQQGGRLIMSSPLLTPHCHGATISISVCWDKNQLKFKVKKPAHLDQPASQLFFDSLEGLIEAIQSGIADNREEVFNFAPVQLES